MRRSPHSISVIAMSCLLVLGALPSLALAADPNASGANGPRVGGPYRAGATTKSLKAIAKEHPASRGTARTVQPEGLGQGTTSSSPSVVKPDGAPQTDATPGEAPQELTAPLVSFAGQTSGFTPPDPVGDVGPTQYVQMINSTIAVYDKQGNVVSASTNINNLWINGTTAGTGFDQCRTQNAGDPIVLYDQQADRWMVSQFTNPNSATGPGGTFPMCIAYSQTGSAAGNWFLYQFNLPSSQDYMKYGIWPDGLYMSTFEGSSLGAYVFDRAAMLSGSAATFQYFSIGAGSGVNGRGNRILPADWDGMNPPAAGAPHPFAVSYDDAFDGGNDRIVVYDFHTDWTTPANSTFAAVATLNTAAFDTSVNCTPTFRDCIPQPGTTTQVDALSNRMMHRLQYRNFGDHESMVVTQTVDGDGNDRAGVRWYELRDTGTGWSIFQQGTYAPNDGIDRWMPSAAMDSKGNIAVGYSVSDGTSVFPGLRYTGRAVADAPGSLPQGEQTLVSGTTAQTGSNRWGDYSAMTVDPVDDCTFWYTGQYNGSSGTWIGSFRFPSCSATDLSVTKSADPTTVVAGTSVTFTVTVTNGGPNTANGVTLVDTMPAGISANSVAATNGGACSGGSTITCTWPSLLAGATANVTIQATVPSNYASNTATNSATVSMANQSDTNPANNSASATITIARDADLAVTKQCKPDDPAAAGTNGTCQIFVDNLGPSTAQGVVLTDALVANAPFSVTSVTASSGICAPTSTPPVVSVTITCNIGTMGPGDRVTVDIAITSPNATDVNDTATVSSSTPDPNPSNNRSTGSVRFFASADLSITKTDITDPVVAGTTITYRIDVANAGPSTATGVVVTDYLPAALVDGTVTATPTVGTCTVGTPGNASKPTVCNLGNMASGATASIIISGKVDPATLGTVTNDAVVSSATADPVNGNNRATVDTTINGQANLSLQKIDTPDPVKAGKLLTYELKVSNAGPSLARNVLIVDDLPSSYVTLATADPGCTLVQPLQVRCSIGDLAPGATKSVFVTVLVSASTPAGTKLDNTATVSSDTADPNPANNTATAQTTVATEAELWLDKQGVLRTGNPSPAVVYTIVVHNDAGCETDAQSTPTPNCGAGGPSDAQNVVVYDKLPLDAKKFVVQFVSPSCIYTKSSHSVTCSVAKIPAGASVSFVIEAQANGSVGLVSNTASIQSSGTPDPVTANNTNTVTITVKGGTGKGK